MIEGFYKERNHPEGCIDYYFVKKVNISLTKEEIEGEEVYEDEANCVYDEVCIYNNLKTAKFSSNIKEYYPIYEYGEAFYDMKRIKSEEYEEAIEKMKKIMFNFLSETRKVLIEKV